MQSQSAFYSFSKQSSQPKSTRPCQILACWGALLPPSLMVLLYLEKTNKALALPIFDNTAVDLFAMWQLCWSTFRHTRAAWRGGKIINKCTFCSKVVVRLISVSKYTALTTKWITPNTSIAKCTISNSNYPLANTKYFCLTPNSPYKIL